MSQTCTKCGSALSTTVLNGLCPACLIDFSAGPVRTFGDYELLDEIARGGMGIVYRARQRSLDRVVAIKLILSGQFASEQSKERFRIEARAAANLQHPWIVPVHEVGEQDGFQFYTMDYIPGQSLAEVARESPMAPQKAAECVKQIAEAIEYAHQHGVLHRDLKPSNVLLDPAGNPHVTDFGLAKTSTGETNLTVSGEMLGSPHYIPPEQACGNAKSCGPWSDVYSLGAILYRLVTGRAPFMGQTISDTLSQVLEKEPVAPRLLVPRIPRDLETICLKCMQKEPHRRYQAAQEVAEELGRFLAGKPIRARPISYFEKVCRWCRREPAIASLIGIALLLLVAGSLLVLTQWRRAETTLEHNRQLLYLADMRSGFTSLADGELSPLRAALHSHIPTSSQVDMRGFEWRYLWARAYPDVAMRLPERPQAAGASRFSPDGTILAVYYWNDTLRLWDMKTGQESRPAFTNVSALGAFTKNGKEYVLGGRDGAVRFCNLQTGEITRKIEGVGEVVTITPDGNIGVTINNEHLLKVIDLTSAKVIYAKQAKVSRHSDSNWGATVAIADDGRTLAVSLPYEGTKSSLSAQTKIELYDLETQKELPRIQQIGELESLLFTHDGRTLIAAWGDGSISLSEIDTGNLRTFRWHKLPVLSLALSADGSTLASGSADESIQLWELPSGKIKPPVTLSPLGHVWSLAISADGAMLAVGSRNAAVTVLDLRKAPVPETISGLSPEHWGNFTFSPDSRLMAAVCKGDILKVWETDSFREVAKREHVAYVMTFSADSKALLASSRQHEPFWWNRENDKIISLPARGVLEIDSADVSRDGRLGVLGYKNGTLQLVDIESGTNIATWAAHNEGVRSVKFSAGLDKIISGGRDRSVVVWDRITQKKIASNPGEHRGAVCSVVYSQSADRIASGCGADVIKIWDPADLSKALATLSYHKGAIQTLDFSMDGRTLASGSEDGTMRLFSVQFKEELAVIRMDSPVRVVLFSPDGNTLAIVADSGTLRLLRATSFERADAQARALRQ
jgi:eukaryotic-like serine/threonine-protein kinase